MNWKVRHQGSPRSVEGLTLAEVVEGLQDGLWEPTDEVQGPDDADWVAIENHPQLADVAADLEPPPPRVYDDETRLDFNPLIDVCLVLLVFFILTTSYAVLQKRLELPNVTGGEAGIPVVTKEQVAEQMIHVTIKMEDGKPVFRVEKKVVPEERLLAELTGFVRQTKRSKLLLEHDYDVPHGAVVAVQDAAKGADMERVLWLVPDAELKR
jgi:biopolymer transport protein ExbD